jgi:hypothetical protein
MIVENGKKEGKKISGKYFRHKAKSTPNRIPTNCLSTEWI